MDTTLRILEAFEQGPLNPGEVSRRTGLPRYEVLAAIRIMEELGFIERIYSRGTHRVYILTSLGVNLLQALRKGGSILLEVKTSGQGEAVAQS